MLKQLTVMVALTTAANVGIGTKEGQRLKRQAVDAARSAAATYEVHLMARELHRAQINDRVPSRWDFGRFIEEEFHSYEPDRELSLDPWGNPYRLEATGEHYVVTCDGPDGLAYSDDDIKAKVPIRDFLYR